MSSQGKCNVCKKEIRESEECIHIGYNKEGNFLKRHKKCNPGLPNFAKVRKSQTLEKRHYIKESDKAYNRNKEKREIKKEIQNES